MKKLFTFIFAAALAVSCWGTDIQIGELTTAKSEYLPICATSMSFNSITQILYLASELTSAGAKAGNIEGISFYYNGSTDKIRTLHVRMNPVDKVNLAKSAGSGNPYYYISKDIHNPGPEYFFGKDTLKTAGGWHKIRFTTPFAWDGTSNIIITVNDSSNERIAMAARYHKTYTATECRSLYLSGSSGTQYNASNTSNIQGTATTIIPVIRFSFAGGDPEPKDPELTITCASPDFGTFAKEYETRSTTITVTGKNLTEDVTISAADGMTVDPASLTKEAVMATGGAVVTVTTNSSFVSGKKVTISGDKIEKTVTFTGTEATFIERSGYTFLYTSDLGSYSLLVGPTEIASVDASAQTFVLGTTSQACTIDYSAVSGTFLAKGKISNLKVKKTGEGLFKAFTFNYTAPAASDITINENADNSAILAENDGQTVDIKFIRSFTKDMYNTICLPISIGEAIVENMFGTGYSLVELTSSTFENEAINLVFTGKKAIEAGKPYLIKPKKDVTDPQFTNYLVSKNLSTTTTTYADFIPTFSPTDLSQSENILFLGTGDELFYPAQAGTLKGLRCYFLIKGTTNAPVRMQINKDNSITEIIEIQSTNATRKTLVNGQIVILRGEKKYTINGQEIK